MWIVPITQGLLDALAAVIVFKIGRQLFSERVGLIAGLCYALDLSALAHTFSMLTESLFTFLFLIANFFLIRSIQNSSRKNLLFSAISLGVATLCRPVALYYFISIVVILLFANSASCKIRARYAMIYVSIFLVTISPWIIRNKLTFGVMNLTSIQGINLLLMNAAFLKAAQENLDYRTAERLLENEADSLIAAQGLSAEKMLLTNHGKEYGYQVNDPQQARVYQKLAVEKILASPLLYARIHLTGMFMSLLDTSVRDLYYFSGKERPAFGLRVLLVMEGIGAAIKKFWSKVNGGYLVLYLFNLVWLMLHYGFAGYAVYQLVKERNFIAVALLMAPVIYLLFMTAPAGSERFRFPAMPYLYLLSAFALARFNNFTFCLKRASLTTIHASTA